jgi:acetyl esterase/lipase
MNSFRCLLILPALLLSTAVLHAGQKETPQPMNLWPEAAPGAKGKDAKDIPTVTVYLPKASEPTAAVVICPGGGYGNLAMDHEGHQVARWLNSIGVAGIIVKYRVAPYQHPAPIQDAQRAIRFVRHNAEKWNIDPAKVGILGFSAGGHLASTAATHFDAGDKSAKDPVDQHSCRPDFAVLGYPVISFLEPFTHAGSRKNLLGTNPDPDLVKSLSNETQVTKDTPPTFLVHTNEDKGVPAENSIVFYLALRKAGVRAEMHIFEKGRHGLGLGGGDAAFARWPGLCEAWLQARGILKTSAK